MKRRLSSTTRNVSAFHGKTSDGKAVCGARRKWGVLLEANPREITCRRCRALMGLPVNRFEPLPPEPPQVAPSVVEAPAKALLAPDSLLGKLVRTCGAPDPGEGAESDGEA